MKAPRSHLYHPLRQKRYVLTPFRRRVLLAGITPSTGTENTTGTIPDSVRQEWEARWGTSTALRKNGLSLSLEEHIPVSTSRRKQVLEKVGFQLSQVKLIVSILFRLLLLTHPEYATPENMG